MTTTNTKTALIAGASGGIGRAVATMLAGAGYRTALVGRDRQKLDEVAASIEASSPIVATCDITDRDQVKAMVESVRSGLGEIDVLVCAAGVNVRQRSLRALDPADWDRVIAANLTGAFNLVYYVVQGMRARGGGLVVQISSLAGLRASTVTGAAYSAAKFGQTALGICLGREERGRGVRSSVICSGEVDTGLLDVRAARPGGGEGAAARREGILKPEDVASAVLFLAELPPRAHVPELVIKPVIDDFS